MESKPSSPPQENKEAFLNKSLESIENSTLKTSDKVDLALLLLGKKQGAQLGDFKVINTAEEKESITKEFTEELSEILRLISEIDLKYTIIKELRDDDGIIGFSILVSKDETVLHAFVEAGKNNDDKTFGSIVGYPATAVETYNTSEAFNIEERLSPEELEKLQKEGVLPFLLFMPSKKHWPEELEWARANQKLIKEKTPKLYQELV